MVEALHVQYAMHGQMRKMRFKCLALPACFFLDNRQAKYDVAGKRLPLRICKREYIGRIVALPIRVVQLPTFCAPDQPKGDLGVLQQARSCPTAKVRCIWQIR